MQDSLRGSSHLIYMSIVLAYFVLLIPALVRPKDHYVNPPTRGFSRMPKERRSRRLAVFAANTAWLAVLGDGA